MSGSMIDGVGEQLPQPDPRGALVFRYLPPEIAASEDATVCADFDRLDIQQGQWGSAWFDRAATAAEKALLEHLGYTLPDGTLKTRVSFPAGGVRRRTWPQIGV